jgi:Flp pilus assembly protein TadD
MPRSIRCGAVTRIAAAILLLGAPGSGAKELADYEKSGAAFEEGRALSERKLDRAAIQAYEEAIRRDPAFVEAMVNVARLHLRQGEPEAASRWLDLAMRVEPRYPALHSVRGLVALEHGELQDALAAFGRARALSPEDVEILANLGATLLRLGVLGEARTVLEQALRLEPARPEAVLNLALVFDQRGDAARATFLYRRFLGLVPTADPDREPVERRVGELTPHVLKMRAGEPE